LTLSLSPVLLLAMSIPSRATHVVLAERPVGPVSSKTFAVKNVSLPSTLSSGEVMVRIDWISMDPAMRGW
jgi:NADPH-dependent curcumin reductase CurA